MMNPFKELEEELNPILKQIIFDLRPEGKINQPLFHQLYEKLDSCKELLKGHEVIPRSIAGKLFYLFSTMIVEAKYKDFSEEIMDEAFRLRVYLLNVLDDRILDSI